MSKAKLIEQNCYEDIIYERDLESNLEHSFLTPLIFSFQDNDYLSKWFWELENMPTVILIDGLSASSSEIFALALKEKQWAIVVWKQSYGKWTIQTLFDFDDGTSLKYTVWKRFSPNGNSIDDEWIIPDVEESVDITWYVENWIDSQLEKAKDVLIWKIK